MEHYFTNNPTSKSEERMIEYEIGGKKYTFISDNGVFSKNHVDVASAFFIKTIFEEVCGDVLDVGCGYGVIGITLSNNNKVKSVTMLDINERALELSKKNIALNHAENVTVIASDGFQNIPNSFDTIVTNPPIRAGKEVIYRIYEESKNHLKEGGKLFLVINKKHGAPSTIKFLTQLYGNCEIVDKKAGFHVLRCINE